MAENRGSWLGHRVRKGEREGIVIRDNNGLFRILIVQMVDNGDEERIVMNNVGEDPEEVHEWEWWYSSGSLEPHWAQF